MPSGSGAETDEAVAQRLRRIAAARRDVESSLMVSLVALASGLAVHAVWMLVLLSTLLTIRAVIALHASLDHDAGRRVASVLAMFVPLVSLVVMAVLCARATRRIRADAHRLPPFDPLRR